MSLFDGLLAADGQALRESTLVAPSHSPWPPRRTARFEDEPGYYDPAKLWLYGTVRLVRSPLACIRSAFGLANHSPIDLDRIEREAESLVLDGKVLVCAFHNAAHQRAAIVPLRWGAPRILVMSGGFLHHLGEDLKQEPFRAARLWRYAFDPSCDLAISRRAPDKKPTFASHNPTVDRLIARLVNGEVTGPLFECNRPIAPER